MSKSRIAVIACVCAFAGIAATVAQAAPGDTLGISTLVQRIMPSSEGPGFKNLTTGPGEDYIVRTGSAETGDLGTAGADRVAKRTSLGYFGQLTDFQLADEESPARVEFLDSEGGAFTASWRPSEAFNPHEANEMIEQMNAFAANAPVTNGDGSKPPMDFVMNTGDISDSQQYNETLWNRQLIEGGSIAPGSGIDPAGEIDENPLCPSAQIATLGGIKDAATPTDYTGVQDRDDWPNAQEYYFYDPDEPNPPAPPPPYDETYVNPYSTAPAYPGLMDAGQKPFTATGLDVPGYVLFGNHDGLVQGNVWASKLFNQFAQGCLKPVADQYTENADFDPNSLLGLVLNPNLDVPGFLGLVDANPDQFMAVPPDPDRRLISKKTYMDIFKANNQDDGHGFGFIDPAEAAASNGSAGYYAYSKGGVRYITLDTHSEGGKVLVSDKGNLDTPQFEWFESELKAATDNNEIAVVFSHHAPESMSANVPDEAPLGAPPCTPAIETEIVGCDADPRVSTPIKLKDDVVALMHKYPAAVAWVAGHSHENKIIPYKGANGGFWSIRSSALVDWPKQNRLLQIFDNKDGNLSIFGTLIDHAAPVPAPPAGTDGDTMTAAQLASTGRTIGYNDNQNGGESCGSIDPCGAGTPEDRNVELLVKDPRRPVVPVTPKKAKITKVKVTPKKKKLKAGKKTRLTVRVTNGGNAAATRVKVRLKSSNRRVKVRKAVVIKRIAPGKTAKVKITVRAKRKARGKAKVTARVGKRKGAAVVKVKKAKRRR